MGKSHRCNKEIISKLISFYDDITEREFNGDYLKTLNNFENIAEEKLRVFLDKYYLHQRAKDQAWRSCKGNLYEYAVYKYLLHLVNNNKTLINKIDVVRETENLPNIKEQIKIKNWVDIFPDVDIFLLDKETNKIKAILSCKTSLRERLTETAFWKRELEKANKGDSIKLFFITTDKDNELKIETNRYIILHVIDHTFITDLERYNSLINHFTNKYKEKKDFNIILEKIHPINFIDKVLNNL